MSENNQENSDSANSMPMMIRIITNPRILFGGTMIYIGAFFPILLRSESSLFALLERQGPLLLGALLAGAGAILFVTEMNKIKRKQREDRFIDIDDDRSSDDSSFQRKILAEIHELKQKTDTPSDLNIEELIEKVRAQRVVDESKIFDSFENYFNEIRTVLTEQAHTADKKASILLDKGTAYSKGGITFFISSIIIWQILSWATEFQQQYIYGIVSCSLLFVFIEFLAAWFLKQYRHFVDTSTYLIKVKSIFDKYMLSFLTISSLGGNDGNEKYKAMLKILEDEIRWPETYLLKNADISFAKEAMENDDSFCQDNEIRN